MQKKTYIPVLLIVITCILMLAYISLASTSEARVVRCFHLKTGFLGATNSELEKKLYAKFPKGTNYHEVEAYLENTMLSTGNRNWREFTQTETEKGVHCHFSGGGLFEIVFREYVVSFYFAKESYELMRITVAYGVTGP